MSTVLVILSIIESALTVLKQIPQTSLIADKIAAFETAFVDVLAAAQKAHADAQLGVDPSKLGQIGPVV
jgi:hypothetical protein